MSQIQAELCSMWSELLADGAIDPGDDFFEIGGTSLIALKMVQAIRAKYATNIDLEAFFESPTVASLASMIEARPLTDTSGR